MRGLWQNRSVVTPSAKEHPMRIPCLVLLLFAAGLVRAGDAPAPICTDRPTKSTGTCTADAGHLQLETDLASYTRARGDGVRTDTWVALNPTLKYGLDPTLDVEVNVALYTDLHVRGAGSTRGSGDAWLKLKQKLVTGPALEVALMPVLKVPSASRALGNGAWEGGVLLPVVGQLSQTWSVNLSPEIDVAANASGHGHHLATAQLVNLGRTLAHDVTLSVEVWGEWDADPAGHHSQASFDLGAAWLLGPDLQLDGGINLGLKRETPAVQAYVGVARRF
jgi:hypothetical protein